MSGVRHETVTSDEDGLRLDRWFKARFPTVGHVQLQKLLRTGQVRVDGARVKAAHRLAPGETVRVPPLADVPPPRGDEADLGKSERAERAARPVSAADRQWVQSLVLHRDADVLAIAKPSGLPVQGGTATARHLDALLPALQFDASEPPRLVHRLDKDTSGILLLARSRASAAWLGQALRERTAQKLYWALVVGVPKPASGRIDAPLAKRGRPGEERVRIAEDDADDGARAVTEYEVVENAGRRLAWVALMPLTGRTHQLRAHMAALGNPIVGDGKYGGGEAHPGGEIPRRLHLHARAIRVPRPAGGWLSLEAPLESHMRATFKTLGFDADAPPSQLDFPATGARR